MNLQHLKYMTEIERTGSVTKAAANLFMGQPNLSKAIREVENETGITVFRRSAKGVYPTPEGARLLARARAVLAEMEKLEAVYKREKVSEQFTFCVPSGEYVPPLAAELAGIMSERDGVNIECVTASLNAAAEKLGEGTCRIAAVRCPRCCTEFFNALVNEKKLCFEPLRTAEYMLIVSQNCPLADAEEISHSALGAFTRISSEEDIGGGEASGRQIIVNGGADCLELLSLLPDSYMLSAPLWDKLLKKYGLIEKKIEGAEEFTDYLLFPSGFKHDEYTAAFSEAFKRMIKEAD